MEVDVSESAEPTFRSSKRRKVFRQRASTSPPAAAAPALPADDVHSPLDPSPASPSTESDERTLSVTEILRLRKLGQKPRRGGIGYSNNQRLRDGEDGSSRTLTVATSSHTQRDEGVSAMEMAQKRFAPQTGMVADVEDTHMNAYVDSRLHAARFHAPSTISHNVQGSVSNSALPRSAADTSKASTEKQAASLGLLQEIDLGPDAALRNARRTEAAANKLASGTAASEEDEDDRRTTRRDRPGLTGDGKPVNVAAKKKKKKKRRASDDLRRDALVEAVFGEHKLPIYEPTDTPANSTTAKDGQSVGGGAQAWPAQEDEEEDADAALAERFQRDFLEQAQNRQRRPQPPPSTSAKGAAGADAARGPKLGGSRSARAAMRAKDESAKKGR